MCSRGVGLGDDRVAHVPVDRLRALELRRERLLGQERGVLEVIEVAGVEPAQDVVLGQQSDDLLAVEHRDRGGTGPRQLPRAVGERRPPGDRRLDGELAQGVHSWKRSRYPVAIRSDMIVTGIPTIMKRRNGTGRPLRSSTPVAATFAAAAIGVAFPPKQAPSASAHQFVWSVDAVAPLAWSSSTTGIIAAVKGMLSTSAEPAAPPQTSTSISFVADPPVRSPNSSATSVITPCCSSAPTMTNRPTKKKIVAHSTRSSAASTSSAATSRSNVAPLSATTAGSTPSVVCRKKATIVPTSTATERFT